MDKYDNCARSGNGSWAKITQIFARIKISSWQVRCGKTTKRERGGGEERRRKGEEESGEPVAGEWKRQRKQTGLKNIK